MTARDAVALQGNPSSNCWFVVITDYDGACGTQPGPSSKTIVLSYTGTAAPGAGTSQAGDTAPWHVQYTATDASGGTADDLAISGTVTLASVTAPSVSGTFDLVFGGSAGNSNEHVTGSFTAPTCPTGTSCP